MTTSNQVYRVPHDAVLEMIEDFDPGVHLTIKLLPLAGFTRSTVSEGQSPA